MMKLNTTGSVPPLAGIAIFWASCVGFLAAFWLPMPWSWILGVVAIEPILYGSHEALHGHFVPRHSRLGGRKHQEIAAVVGTALQGMNLYLLRPAHLHHHRYGRYDDGYAPDVAPTKPTLLNRLHYYVYLIGLPGLLWQGAGFARLLRRPENLPFLAKINFRERLDRRYFVAQGCVIATLAYLIAVGGFAAFAAFEVTFCLLWSVQQNIAHYGLRGVDPETDRVCARSYYLPWPLNWITYGSTAHFLHHADTSVPAWELYDEAPLRRAEDRLGISVVTQYGVWPFLRDAFKQFKGPIRVHDLETTWMQASDRPSREVSQSDGYSYRRGRRWSRSAAG